MEKVDYSLFESAGMNHAEWEGVTIYEPTGCSKCNNIGYKGRMAIHEALYFTNPVREIIVSSGVEVDEKSIREQAKRDGTLTLRESGLEKVKLGLTSIQEVIAATMQN
jgi:type IV pilus assembly protein PilB